MSTAWLWPVLRRAGCVLPGINTVMANETKRNIITINMKVSTMLDNYW